MQNNVIARGGPSAAGGASSTAEFQFQDSASAAIMARIGPGHLDRKAFLVRASGRVTGGTTTNFTVRLDYGTSTTIASNTTIEASSARAVNSESGNWFIEAYCFVDSTSDKIQGFGRSMVNLLFDVEAAIDAEPSVDPSTAEIGFTCTGQFSASDAGNTATLDNIEIIEL